MLYFVLCFVTAAGGGYITRSALTDWYPTLRKPSWNPPNQVFGPVWTVLYVLMAWAATQLSGFPLALWGLQLALNFLWSWFFFGLRSPRLALADIGLLWLVLLALVASCHGLPFWLLLPYLLWVSFAAALNFEICRLNPDV